MSENTDSRNPVRHHRTLILSDLHLGAFGARADLLLRFLRDNRAEIYLFAGDVLDLGHRMLSSWTEDHEAVLEHLRLRKAAGATIIYVRGNHDPAPEAVPAGRRLPVEAVGRAVHVAADGRRYLVIHGDEVDARLLRSHVVTRLGTVADRLLRGVDSMIEQYVYSGNPRRRSVIETLLSLANRGLAPRRAHERRLAVLAREAGFDGVICGHFHLPALRDLGGVRYANCGDWLDSFTALAEDFDGGMRLIGGRAVLAAPSRPEAVSGVDLDGDLARA